VILRAKMNLKKDINNIHDRSYKDLYSNKEIFIDLVKKILNAPWAKELKAEQLTLVNKSYIASDYEENESDIVYRANVNGSEVIFYILLEFQSSLDYRMPLRLFFYISEILREYAKNAEHKAYDKKLKIPAVVPLVLYNGKAEWDVPTSFRDIVKNEELFGDNIIDFKYNLFDVNNKYSKEELIKEKSVTSAIFLLDQKIEPKEFLDRIKTIALFFNSLNEKELQVLKHWIENSVEARLAKEAVKILNSSKEEVETMVASNAFIITEMEQQAQERGIKEGINIGIIEGIKEGKKETKEEVAINLLKLGINEDVVIKATELSVEKVRELKEKLKN
jgi:predicted transposase/invertase (TIGR01784 family)